VRFAPGISLARGLGWFSIGLGLAEILAPRKVASLTGVQSEALLQAYGVREVATGVGILSSRQPASWMWGRVIGDILDLATLLAATQNGHQEKRRALAATAAVAGVTALDVTSAVQLSAACALEG
jgi:hypothetical protein